MKQLKYLIASALICSCVNTQAVVIGSDTAVSTQPFYLFSASPNRIANFAWMQGGFGLQNPLTSLLFDSVFPVSGTVQINGGTLTLNRDLIFDNVISLQGLGTIIGSGHVLSLSPGISAFPSSAGTFQDITLVLNNDLMIKSALNFVGTCAIQANGHTLTINNAGSISVAGSLVVQNAVLDGVQGTNIECVNDASSIILDTVTWNQIEDFNFILGALSFNNAVIFNGSSIFAYTTMQTSTIASSATVLFDAGFTFSYDPSIASQHLIEFVDATSQLLLNGATLYASGTGLQLTYGSMMVQGNSAFSCDNEINIGDNAGHDFAVTIAPGASLNFLQGLLNYENVNLASWIMQNSGSTLDMSSNTTLALYQTMDLGSGVAVFENNSTLARVPSATLDGSITTLGTVYFVVI